MANHIVTKHQQVEKKNKTTKRKTKANTNKEKKSFGISWIHNRKLQIICGIFLIIFSIFLFFSFISFFTTHNIDNTIANSNIFTTIRNGNSAQYIGNKLGIMGLYFSFLFIQFSFGIASFGFLFLFFLWGIYLISKRALLPLLKSFLSTCLCVIWFSLLTGGLFGKNSNWEWLGGNIGNYLSQALIETSVGGMGFALLMIFFAIVILVSFFGLTFHRIIPEMSEKNDKNTKAETDYDEKETQQSETIALTENDNTNESDIVEKEKFATKISHLFHKKEKEVPSENPFKGPIHVASTYPPENETQQQDAEKTEEPATYNTETISERKESNITVKEAKSDIPETEKDKHSYIPGNDVLLDESMGEKSLETENDTQDDQENNSLQDIDNDSTSNTGTISEEEANEAYISSLPPFDPRDELIHYQFPTADLLEAYTNATRSKEEREEEIQNNKVRIKTILSNFGVEIQSISAIEGPTITMYEIVPAVGVRINKIKNLEDDIALSVAAIGIRIIAPIPGKGSIGIEIPNSSPRIVPMKDAISSDKFINNTKMALPIAIGRTISNEVFLFDLAKMPHVLMAGATGQGKSVGLNAVLVSLLYHKHPSELKLVLVDPKKVELTLYSKIERHYLAKIPGSEAIITDTKQVVRTLNSLCIEMDNRYELLKKAQCRNIIEYNEKFKSRHLNPENGHRYLPYIVLVFDEFADCIMTAGREVESPIARLAQLARAIGIHLIIATQRPSVNIITGVIKANFPARIAFRVSSRIDSRTILDAGGAERLIGKGDMLISTGSEITRIQCALVDTPEIERICDFIGEQHGFTGAYELPEVPEEQEDNTQSSDDGETDAFFAEAAKIVVQTGHGSTSLLQRKLKLGYNRAGRIMDQLEREGIVGAFEGSKAREVLIRDSNQLDEKLKNMGLL